MLRVGLQSLWPDLSPRPAGPRHAARQPQRPRSRRLHFAIAEELGARTLEIFEPWLAGHGRRRAAGPARAPRGARHDAGRQRRADRWARSKARSARRARWRKDHPAWPDPGAVRRPQRLGREMADEARTRHRAALGEWGPRAARRGLTARHREPPGFHQRRARRLLRGGGAGVGIIFDTGNTFPVAEAPLDFTRRVAPHMCATSTSRTIACSSPTRDTAWCAAPSATARCPFREMWRSSPSITRRLPAVLEPGALEARHVRLFTPDWWNGYPPKRRAELAACLRRRGGTGCPTTPTTARPGSGGRTARLSDTSWT